MGGICGKPQTATAPAPPVVPGDKSVTGRRGSQFWSNDNLESALLVMPGAVVEAKSAPLPKAQPLPKQPSATFASEFSDWNFDIFSISHSELTGLAYAVLTSHPELSAPPSKIDKHKLWRFVCEIGARYYSGRPFHSFRHGVDVLLATSTLLRLIRQDHALGFDDPIVVGALLIAALVHDTNHPGCMNSYLIATKHPLAAESQAAVLERHHAEMALTLLDRPELDFLCKLNPADRTRFVDFIREMVIATDVTTTMPKAKEFTAKVAAGETPTPQEVMTILIKAADISNPSRSPAVYKRWVDGVMTEFFAQGDAERERGLTISMNCDRHKTQTAACQVGFISFLVGPLLHALYGYAPALQPLIDNLEANKQFYADEAAANTKAAEASEVVVSAPQSAQPSRTETNGQVGPTPATPPTQGLAAL